jgi:DNA processing protein
VPGAEAGRALHAARELIARSGIGELMLLVHGMAAYPTRLRDARHPIEVLYAQGRPEILERDAIAVVGTRSPSRAGAACARAAARHLARRGFVILSGLAAGIDALAHHAAIDAGAVTAAVLGTPLTAVYPPANAALQRRLAREFLLLSQVPIVRHAREGPTENRHFFRERNATLAALARAVVIVEAGDRSGALICARHALEQGRRVFMAARSRGDARLAWPARLERQGAIVVRDLGEIDEHLAA